MTQKPRILSLLVALAIGLISHFDICGDPGEHSVQSERATLWANILKDKIDLSSCRMANGDSSALCGKYEVFEDRTKKAGRKISLKIVVLPALTQTPAPDPVFFLAGGPGSPATILASGIREGLLSQIRKHRTAVFIDQRGTGESNPLHCKLYYEDRGLQGYLSDLFPLDLVRACRRQLETHADLRFYTTPIAMDDVDEVRAALGYERINLYGTSYAPLAALTYLRQYPNRVRSVSIGGIATPSMKMPLQFPRGTDRALERLLADCAVDAACNGAFPKLKEELAAVLARFEKGPIQVNVVNPKTNQSESVSFSKAVFVERVRRILYQLGPSSQLPLFIHLIYQGNYAPLTAGLVPPPENPATSMAIGLYLTATCSESVWRITEEEIQRETRGAFIGDNRLRRHRAACREWVRGPVPKNFFEPLKSDVPVLMLSGELDGATPPEYSTAMLTHLPNGRQVLIPNEAHGYQSPCLVNLVAAFIDKGSTKELDTACVKELRRPPFVTRMGN